MIRSYKAFLAIACAIGLSGCVTAASIPLPTVATPAPAAEAAVVTTPTGGKVEVSRVQAIVARACGIQPTFASVVRVAGSWTGYGFFGDLTADVSDAFARSFCPAKVAAVGDSAEYASMKPKSKKSKVVEGQVNGVPVQGVVVSPKASPAVNVLPPLRR